MRILGIDPGYAIVGFGILEADSAQPRLLRCGAINTQAGVPMPMRLAQIQEDMKTLIGRFAPDVMAIEELFFNTNVTTGIGVAQARGVILATAAKMGVQIYEYTPSQVKQAVVGYGKAEKRQVMEMTKRILHLPAIPKPDDAADAVAIALCHARSHTSKLNQAARAGAHAARTGTQPGRANRETTRRGR
jgi:crossover junction endodeoxyribonuclease RuvC